MPKWQYEPMPTYLLGLQSSLPLEPVVRWAMTGPQSGSVTTGHDNPARDRLSARLLAKVREYARELDIPMWIRRLEQAEWALHRHFDTGRKYTSEFYESPVPTTAELTIWRNFAVECLEKSSALNHALIKDPRWIETWPEVVREAEQVRQQAYQILSRVDSLLLQLELRANLRKIPMYYEPPAVHEFMNLDPQKARVQ